MARVTVRLTGWPAKTLGPRLEVDAETIEELLERLIAAGIAREHVRYLLAVRKGAPAAPQERLDDGETVTVFPLMSGG